MDKLQSNQVNFEVEEQISAEQAIFPCPLLLNWDEKFTGTKLTKNSFCK